jgi:hypothetical protein
LTVHETLDISPGENKAGKGISLFRTESIKKKIPGQFSEEVTPTKNSLRLLKNEVTRVRNYETPPLGENQSRTISSG